MNNNNNTLKINPQWGDNKIISGTLSPKEKGPVLYEGEQKEDSLDWYKFQVEELDLKLPNQENQETIKLKDVTILLKGQYIYKNNLTKEEKNNIDNLN